jgi:hypothetical protein
MKIQSFRSPLAVFLLSVLASGLSSAAIVPLVPVPGAVFDEDGAERIDIEADSSFEVAALLKAPSFAVIKEWEGFEGKGTAQEFSNYGELPDGTTLRGRLVFKQANDTAPWAGRAMDRREHRGKALNTRGYTAIILPGTGHMQSYELGFGSGTDAGFRGDRVVRALAFVVTNLQVGENVTADFYNAAGDLLISQHATSIQNEDTVANYQGQEVFFCHIASADPAAQIQRVVVRLRASNQYKDLGIDAVGFTPAIKLR